MDWSIACARFLQHTKRRGDNSWELRTFAHAESEKTLNYLVRVESNIRALVVNESNDSKKDSLDIFPEIQETELERSTAITNHNSSADLKRFDYHIIWSPTFSAPVLYFNVCNSDGSPLSYEEIWQCIPECYRATVVDRTTFITQCDHPYLNVPFYYIHPCQTSKLLVEAGLNMSSTSDALKALLCWLSISGPLIGLNYPHEWYVIES